jgi:hypothetical protein
MLAQYSQQVRTDVQPCVGSRTFPEYFPALRRQVHCLLHPLVLSAAIANAESNIRTPYTCAFDISRFLRYGIPAA